MLLTRSPLSPKSASTPWIPFDLHVLSTPPAFILSQDQTLQQKPKNGSSQKTIQQKQTPTIKKQNVPKSSASKKQKTEKTKTPNQTARHPSSIPHKQNKKTHYREHKQPNHKPTKLAGQDSSRAKNKRRESFSPAGLCARQRIQSYRPGRVASNQNAQK